MGFASYYEDICERYYKGGSISRTWDRYLGGSRKKRDIEEARDLFGDPLARCRKVIRRFWDYYRQMKPLASLPQGQWERHHDHIRTLHGILGPVEMLDDERGEDCLAALDVAEQLKAFFRDTPYYGPFSRQVIRQVTQDSEAIRLRCEQVERDILSLAKPISGLALDRPETADIAETLRQLAEIRQQLDRDLQECRNYDIMAEQVGRWGERFLALHARAILESRYRPALQDLDRLRLNEEQERFVTMDHSGVRRIQGASGSGKTLILLHRAIRLAVEHPGEQVRVFTVNRSLSELLSSGIRALHGFVPENLHVAAMYDFLIGVVGLFESTERYRLVDDRSKERIYISWRDFFHHRGKRSRINVFAEPAVKQFVSVLQAMDNHNLDASRYLREEMIFIQSGYQLSERGAYLDAQTEGRLGRSVRFKRNRRELCLRILARWEDWLEGGDLGDVDGITLRAAEHCESEDRLRCIREVYPTDFVLADEAQDLSTLELRLLRLLVADPDGENRFFLVGDLNQKIFAKHYRAKMAGFDFRGRVDVIRQNYRNTREILRAARLLSERYPPPSEEDVPASRPECSPYKGSKPVCIECTRANQAKKVALAARQVLSRGKGQRVAVVSHNEGLLAHVREGAEAEGIVCFELYTVEDIDLWKAQALDPLAARLVLSKPEAVKGFEFDTVILCDISAHMVPQLGTPEKEYWREAAVLYSAMTRARDELVLTYAGEPSVFLEAIADEIDSFPENAEETSVANLTGELLTKRE